MSNNLGQFADEEPDPRDIAIDAWENRIIPAPRPATGSPASQETPRG